MNNHRVLAGDLNIILDPFEESDGIMFNTLCEFHDMV